MATSMKQGLLDELRWARTAVIDKLDGVAEYDLRRPMTASGTNLLGLVNHLSVWEATYLGDVFGRPFPEDAISHDDDLWVPAERRSSDVIGRYQRVAAHADETVHNLALDTPGHVAWWPRPEVTLLNVLVHRIAETNRHVGHMDILREEIDGTTSEHAPRNGASLKIRFEQIEHAARTA